ncbi:hypothetical protein RRG46_02630 [Mycoplasmopsis cynos]|uniref:Variable surface lipoprotein n=1 Tax=Mycoplasmopsis cynos TaxID=171284 RepID=A0ABD8AIC4_9BACT|nr:hypothetical protein [Mycoplasmopsis cynos]UWV80332.1 hypothetical protein NW069_03170 [Mycoplasmopsis cynos]UWV86535.1 hypothetical protein NW063_02370 [Mycoplasmopsis cynos]WAM05819.1 hypothetical protein OM999_00895 [Mycoplasmopsis cynos]WAM08902.1 hypothetical protein ONA03_00700 [Mycoplasmopsis cynos]WQQ19721.1 hypothetical protein RRG46_02630 [Mycoplasmopsis cynos]
MSKYKKIFSGLGLLSISTLVGASVVACANKKPKPSDSSTEGIDQNNNQGNSSKPKDGENTPGNPTPETPKTPEKPEDSTPNKPEKTPEQGDGSSSENPGKTNENDKKDKPDEGMKKEPEKPGKDQTPLVTLEQKLQETNMKIEVLGYPDKNAKAKATLKAKASGFKTIEKLNEFDKELDLIKTKLDEVKSNIDKLEYPSVQLNPKAEKSAKDKFKEKLNDKTDVKSISEVLPKDWSEKIKKYSKVFSEIGNFIDTNGLKKRFAQTDNATTGKFTEKSLIWNIYETIRPKYIEKIKALKLENQKEKEYINNFNTKLQNNHNHDVDWLLTNIKNMLDNYKKAQSEPKKAKTN